jgi:hypothetical protein
LNEQDTDKRSHLNSMLMRESLLDKDLGVVPFARRDSFSSPPDLETTMMPQL